MKNPYVNALTAFLYILVMAFFLQTVPPGFEVIPAVFGVAMMLSALVFSVASMGFLFFFQPLCLAIEQKFQESALFFIKTWATFAILFVAMVGVLVVFF